MYLIKSYHKKDLSVFKALSKLIGIGDFMAIQACEQIGISKQVKIKSLSPLQYDLINQIIHQNYTVASENRALINKNKARLSSISCYRGFRHKEGLPCNGQRTHTNARTAKKQRFSAVTSTEGKGRAQKSRR